jgi:type II secretory pathway pseudopilin PulG
MPPRSRRAAFTVIEVAVVLSLLGVLLAVGIPTFVRALRTSKMAEAPEQLQRIYAGAATYYAAPQSVTAPIAPPARAGGGARTQSTERPPAIRSHCLPSPAGPTPEKPSPAPVTVDFADPSTPGSGTWRAIGYAPGTPIRYRYTLAPEHSGCDIDSSEPDSPGLRVRAEGDLDGDGVLSRFERTANIVDGSLVLDPLLIVRDRVE